MQHDEGPSEPTNDVSDDALTGEAPGGPGIYRGHGRRVRRKKRSPVRTMLLSFIWPGLGQWYARQRRRALFYALPPLLLVAGLAVVIAQAPFAFLLNLLAPSFGVLIVSLIAANAIWRSASLIDAWRKTRRQPLRSDRALPLLVVLVGFVVIAHGVVGYYVGSFSQVGGKIFQSGVPTGFGDLDIALGGDQPPATPPDKCPDINPGDTTGYGDKQDEATGPDETVDEEGSSGEPETPFDPAASPPPFVCQPAQEGNSPAAGPINVLIVGMDTGYGLDRVQNDTVMVASYYPAREQVTMISIPRDTARVPLYTGGYYKNRFNSFLAFARRHPDMFPEGPIIALTREVGYILGIQIHFYAATDDKAFPAVVDAVGGVDMTLDAPVPQIPPILFPPGVVGADRVLPAGTYHLNGDQAYKVARSGHGPQTTTWQHGLGQQLLIRALAVRMRDPANAVRAPEIMTTMAELVRTDVPPEDLPALLPVFEKTMSASTEHYVLEPNKYARRIYGGEVRYMTELNMAAVRELCIDVFGEYTRYSPAYSAGL